jgi:hypothetical protein
MHDGLLDHEPGQKNALCRNSSTRPAQAVAGGSGEYTYAYLAAAK